MVSELAHTSEVHRTYIHELRGAERLVYSMRARVSHVSIQMSASIAITISARLLPISTDAGVRPSLREKRPKMYSVPLKNARPGRYAVRRATQLAREVPQNAP